MALAPLTSCSLQCDPGFTFKASCAGSSGPPCRASAATRLASAPYVWRPIPQLFTHVFSPEQHCVVAACLGCCLVSQTTSSPFSLRPHHKSRQFPRAFPFPPRKLSWRPKDAFPSFLLRSGPSPVSLSLAAQALVPMLTLLGLLSNHRVCIPLLHCFPTVDMRQVDTSTRVTVHISFSTKELVHYFPINRRHTLRSRVEGSHILYQNIPRMAASLVADIVPFANLLSQACTAHIALSTAASHSPRRLTELCL